MRVAATRQHPLQTTRISNNGKFLVNTNNQEVQPPQHRQQQQQQQQQLLLQQQSQISQHHHRHHHHHRYRQHPYQQHHQRQQAAAAALAAAAAAATAAAAAAAANGDENTTAVVPLVGFSSCEPTARNVEHHGPTILGDRFVLLGPAEGSALYRCVDVQTGQQLVAKALSQGDKGCEALLQAHLRLEGTDAASGLAGIVEGSGGRRYLLLEGHHGDLHAYVRARRRLREPEARRLFRQAAKAVATCHEYGVVLRDLKLRKFVFADEAKTQLRLESLEDAVIVDKEDDKLTDRRGCPAYVAPEVLRSGRAYSGKAADIWSLGVLLYTMLVGRYPFNDAEHASLFAKISRGQFAVPECLSPRARCLIRSLLRKEPSERPDAEDVPLHPWLSKPLRLSSPSPSPSPSPSSSSSSATSSSSSSFLSSSSTLSYSSSSFPSGRSASQDQIVPELVNDPRQD
ncbi:hypothetical protein HZH66_012707 [Vespula vulgaris]|uniref:Protein kinase domain-containing protein n=1 Tax=Vespula vulgaris TaxID=7454 RepID=A0A834MS60_VESVU|nr:tribbles homolog 2 [Vespula vulgaris]XP_050864068.1 tribbles homolog 2 [Vespula vulgaris]XP_050864069.1 tribbles homolog 2 [Vespula vulgaris]XP_050864071.1 tribbles homolog 2 [Vespula vulgaris]KAF7383357.1 hypothetical protein HZH66_012707 [Vespula vulgaris]